MELFWYTQGSQGSQGPQAAPICVPLIFSASDLPEQAPQWLVRRSGKRRRVRRLERQSALAGQDTEW